MSAGASNSPVFDYTSLDFESVKADLTTYAQTTAGVKGLWTDFNESNFASYLLDLMAYATDLVAYNMNAQVLETLVPTITRKQNFINRGKTYDYTLKPASPSSGTMRLAKLSGDSSLYPFDVTSHQQFSINGVVFQPEADVSVTWPPSSNVDDGYYVDVPLIQGEEQYEELLGSSDGSPAQSFTLRGTGALPSTLTVTVSGVPYTAIDNAVQAGATDRTYTITVDENAVLHVTFGDGVNGKIPPAGVDNITATYKTCEGSSGNYPADTRMSVSGTSDGSSLPVALTSGVLPRTYTSFTGGGPAQTLASGKLSLPAAVKANDRACAQGDYAAIVMAEVAGVFRAADFAGVPYAGQTPVNLFVVPDGGGSPSSVLVNLIAVALRGKKMMGKRVRVLAPIYVSLKFDIDVFVDASASARVVKQKVVSALLTQYALGNMSFGATFSLQDVYELLVASNIAGLKRVFVRTFTVDANAQRYVNRPTVGTGSIEPVQVNLDIVRRREWAVEVVGPSGGLTCRQFRVYQRRLGTVSACTDTLAVDAAAAYANDELITSVDGWVFVPRPEEQSSSFGIVGNTATTITTSAGLLTIMQPDDAYAVQRAEANLGKVLSTLTTAVATSTATVVVASSDNFRAGDAVFITDTAGNVTKNEVASIVSGTSIELATAIGASGLLAGSRISYRWVSEDASTEFSVVDGATPFDVGDTMYVDTYAQAEDITVRSENYPLISAANLAVNTIGGV